MEITLQIPDKSTSEIKGAEVGTTQIENCKFSLYQGQLL
jgi:hypothetical protein